jgi:phage terminase large subunit GpA-like protein
VAQAFQAALDTGGSHTHQAYAFVRRHAHRKLWGVKGESADGKAIKSRRKLIDIKHSGRLLRKGVALWSSAPTPRRPAARAAPTSRACTSRPPG